MGGLWKPIDVVKSLALLDSKLCAPEAIFLCGSAVPVLAGFPFRLTRDIDFAFMPSPYVRDLILRDEELRPLFDFQAQGIVGLLIDVEDRLWRPNLRFNFLQVYCISLEDWVVSKLGSPKLEDVFAVNVVTLEMLYWIRDSFHLYGGTSFERAGADLRHLIRVKEEERFGRPLS